MLRIFNEPFVARPAKRQTPTAGSIAHSSMEKRQPDLIYPLRARSAGQGKTTHFGFPRIEIRVTDRKRTVLCDKAICDRVGRPKLVGSRLDPGHADTGADRCSRSAGMAAAPGVLRALGIADGAGVHYVPRLHAQRDLVTVATRMVVVPPVFGDRANPPKVVAEKP